MILTKDNLARFVVDKKFVTTTDVAEKFETSTMIASAALSELSKAKLVAISDLKLGTTPYYYDINHPEYLVEIGERHLKNHELSIFNKLKTQQIVNDGALSIPEKLAAERITDFSKQLDVHFNGKDFKFWIWYLRDLDQTRQQILEALSGQQNQSSNNDSKKENSKSNSNKSGNKDLDKKIETKSIVKEEKPIKSVEVEKPKFEDRKTVEKPVKEFSSPFVMPDEEPEEEDKVEAFIKNYFRNNYLKIEGKKTAEKFVKYNLSLKVNNLIIKLDAVHFIKKPQDADILKFYMSGNKPKIVFIENAAKKFFKLAESLDNLEVVNI